MPATFLPSLLPSFLPLLYSYFLFSADLLNDPQTERTAVKLWVQHHGVKIQGVFEHLNLSGVQEVGYKRLFNTYTSTAHPQDSRHDRPT